MPLGAGADAGRMEPGSLADVLHSRAIMVLQWRLSQLRGFSERHAALGLAPPDADTVRAENAGTLMALEHVGAISAEERAWWSDRLWAAASWRDPPFEPAADVVARALAHVEELAAPVSASHRDGAQRCFAAIAAYRRIGVLGDDEAQALRDDVRARMGLDPERPPRCSRRRLDRVLAGPATRVQGLRVTSVELYDDGVLLQWQNAWPMPGGDPTPRVWNDVDIEVDETPFPYRLADDLGTRYLGGGGSDYGINGGGWCIRFGSSSFTPAVPAEARRLTAPVAGHAIEIELAP